MILLAGQMLALNGCTSVLWDKETFARHYEPAHSSNLKLFYSGQRRDVLVQYDEWCDHLPPTRQRAYYANGNAELVNNRRKPRFVSPEHVGGLAFIPIVAAATNSVSPSFQGLYAVTAIGDDSFSLYSDGKLLDSYLLPAYIGKSQRVKQVLLTPFALAVDCTIVGAVAAYYWGPYALSALQGTTL